MKFLNSVSRQISMIAAVVGAVCTIALAIAITTDVVSRFLTGRSMIGMVELSETLLVTMVFLGISYGAYVGAHITMTLVTDALPGRVAAWARTISYVLVVGLLAWMFIATGTRALDSYLHHEFKFGLSEWPLWPARTAISIGILIAIPVFVLTLLTNARGALGIDPVVKADASDHLQA